ncbi:MAG: helix-turn-helix domain-containing protein [Halobacteria archaeon]|nr:helix-turn-helix domain-containing protein [Halobacteria archaeon]
MPISRDRFENEPEERVSIREGTNAHKVLEFLVENADKAFTQKEVHEGTGVKRGSLGVVLSRLEDRGLVKHRGQYWAVEEDDRLASYEANEIASSASITDSFSEEDKEEWLKYSSETK